MRIATADEVQQIPAESEHYAQILDPLQSNPGVWYHIGWTEFGPGTHGKHTAAIEAEAAERGWMLQQHIIMNHRDGGIFMRRKA